MPFQMSGHICCATCILHIRFAQTTNNNIFPYSFLIVFQFDRESKMPPNCWFHWGQSALQLSYCHVVLFYSIAHCSAPTVAIKYEIIQMTRGSNSYWLESRFARRVNRFRIVGKWVGTNRCIGISLHPWCSENKFIRRPLGRGLDGVTALPSAEKGSGYASVGPFSSSKCWK